MAETTGLLNRRTGNPVPRVRIPLPPPKWIFSKEFRGLYDPTIKIVFRDVAQSGSAPALGAGGPRFESWYPDNKTTQLSDNQAVAFVVLGIWVVFG